MSVQLHALRTGMLKALKNPSWDKKKKTAFWSAGSRGGPKKPKSRGFRSNLYAIKSELINISDADTRLEEYAQYQFQIYAYGRCGWSRRLRELTYMQAVVFMETSNCTEYFTSFFRPGVDYVPVAEDFSDLNEKIKQISLDPQLALSISQNWLARGENIFSLSCLLGYIDALIRQYAKLQTFQPKEQPDW